MGESESENDRSSVCLLAIMAQLINMVFLNAFIL
jgi:hypothetical protein